MYLVAIAWLYVAVMMAAAEAMHAQGSVLGAIITFLLYGLLPVSLLMYILGTPSRKRARRARELAQATSAHAASDETASPQANDSGHAPGAAQAGGVAPVRKEQV